MRSYFFNMTKLYCKVAFVAMILGYIESNFMQIDKIII